VVLSISEVCWPSTVTYQHTAAQSDTAIIQTRYAP
jgi:hypothetical protein